MPEITTTTITCDFCGKDLTVYDEAMRGQVEAGRYIRVAEVQRPMRFITTLSTDRGMRHSVYCAEKCLASAFQALGDK